ncbi:hypothetical protein PaeBR_01995 [Paenibacillus sp. BR2-3]|uniref:hypothetical protein n=1 Tax=Paenibacillus sp. BR2-3 TaxID=3048494 RepID=UPI00397792D2
MDSKIRNWSEDEDEIFVDMLNDMVLIEGASLGEVYKKVGDRLDRTVAGCQFRYNKKIKDLLSPEVREKIALKNPAVNSKSTGSVVKIYRSSADKEQEISPSRSIGVLLDELLELESRRTALQDEIENHKDKELIKRLIGNRL